MEERIGESLIRLYPSSWRWSASIVGLSKYFDFLDEKYVVTNEYLEFDESSIDEEKYLSFVEKHFYNYMHHKDVEDMLSIENPTDDQIKLINEKFTSNTIMKKTFKGIKYDGNNAKKIQEIIDANRSNLIKQTYKGGRALYYNFCNENNMFKDKGKTCRLRGYYVDMGKKSKSVSYMRVKNNFVYQDSKYFDFIPFAFSRSRETFFINNNYSIQQLIRSNKFEVPNDDKEIISNLFYSVKNSSVYVGYDVEVIKKVRENEYFETIFVRKSAIDLFSKISEDTIEALKKPCNGKRNDHSQDDWLEIEKIVTMSILNEVKLDHLIEKLFKSYNNHKYLISYLIKINQLIYRGGENVTTQQKMAYGAAKEVKAVLAGKDNKIRAYEQRLISAITLKDYDRVQEILLHLSTFTQVKMDFLIDVFEDFEENKNLVYTFINTLGVKKNNKKGESK